MNDTSFKEYVKNCFEIAILVDIVLPGGLPKTEPPEFDRKISITRSDIAIYDMVCFKWVYAFSDDNRFLFSLMWKFYKKIPVRVLAYNNSCSKQTIYNYIDRGIDIIYDYSRKENFINYLKKNQPDIDENTPPPSPFDFD